MFIAHALDIQVMIIIFIVIIFSYMNEACR